MHIKISVHLFLPWNWSKPEKFFLIQANMANNRHIHSLQLVCQILRSEYFYIFIFFNLFNDVFKPSKTGLSNETERTEVEKKNKSIKIMFFFTWIPSLAHITLWDPQGFSSVQQRNVVNTGWGWRYITTDKAGREFLKLAFLYEKMYWCTTYCALNTLKNIVYIPVANFLYSYWYPPSLTKQLYTCLSHQYIHLLPVKVKEGGKEFLITTIRAELQNWNYFISVTWGQ